MLPRTRTSATAALVTVLAGCGTIWGFEDPIDVADGGAGEPAAPDAPGSVCVPKPPEGWAGPTILAEADGASAPPPCPDDFKAEPAYDGHASPKADPATCTCACGAAAGVTCRAVAAMFTDSACTKPCATVSVDILESPGCTAWPDCANFKLTTATAGGSCPASLTSKDVRPWTWSTVARACAPLRVVPGGCASDRVAVPPPSRPFAESTFCVLRTGDAACPSTYPARRVYFAGAEDGRTCAECTCSSPASGACNGSIQGSDNATTCASGLTGAILPGKCVSTPKVGARFTPSGTVEPGTCMPEPHPTGAVVPNAPTTLCCTR